MPDTFLPVPIGPWHGLFVELKRRRGGRLSPEQMLWRTTLQRMGYRVEVALGWEAAAAVIETYVRGGAQT